MTVTELLQLALRDSGAVGMAQVPGPNYIQDAFERLKLLLAEWSDSGLLIPYVTQIAFPQVSGKNTYTIGPSGADVAAARPLSVQTAFLRRDSVSGPSSLDYPYWVTSMDNYAAIREKFASGLGRVLCYNPTFPNGTVYLWPTPDGPDQTFMTGEFEIADPANIFEELVFPGAYRPALQSNLTMEIAAGYGLPIHPHIAAKAERTKNGIVKRNLATRRFAGRPEFDYVSPNIVYDIYGG